MTALAPGQGQWTTYNSPKGRMLATLFLMPGPDGERYAALLARDLVESTVKRLSMFVLRAKVTVRSALDAQSRYSASADRARTMQSSARSAKCRARGHVAMREDTRDRRIGRTDASSSLRPKLPQPRIFDALSQHATPAGAPVWAWLGVRAGVPMITAATQDQFVAQTANWDVLGG